MEQSVKAFAHCIMIWHGPGQMLEVTPMTRESITKADLDDLRAKLDNLALEGWKLNQVTSTRGQYMYVLTKKWKNARSNAARIKK